MDSNIEGEQPKKSEIKSFDESFRPFDPKESSVERIMPPGILNSNGVRTPIVLDTEIPEIGKLPIRISTVLAKVSKYRAVTPFTPAVGYRIDARDFKPETRFEKAREPEYQEDIDFSRAPFDLEIRAIGFNLAKIGVAEEHVDSIYGYRIKKELMPYLKRLRVQVSIPASPPEIEPEDPSYHRATTFEARPDGEFLERGGIGFAFFYPVDTGPLPAEDREGKGYSRYDEMHEGCLMFLPDDMNSLQQVEVKFFLMSEKKHDKIRPGNEAYQDGEEY